MKKVYFLLFFSCLFMLQHSFGQSGLTLGGPVKLRSLYMERKTFIKHFQENKRATFHFYQIDEDSVTLVGWTGKDDSNGDYEKNIVRFKVNDDKPDTVMHPIYTTQIIIKKFLTKIKNNKAKYVLLEPRSKLDSAYSKLFGIDSYHIYYVISLTNDVKEKRPLLYVGTSNPSPPASVSTSRTWKP